MRANETVVPGPPEHHPGWAASKELAIRQDAESTDHNVHPNYATLLDKNVSSYHKRLFLESLHSTLNKNAINQQKEVSTCHSYIPLGGFCQMSFNQTPDEGLQIEAENLRDLCYTFNILEVFYNSKELLDQF